MAGDIPAFACPLAQTDDLYQGVCDCGPPPPPVPEPTPAPVPADTPADNGDGVDTPAPAPDGVDTPAPAPDNGDGVDTPAPAPDGVDTPAPSSGPSLDSSSPDNGDALDAPVIGEDECEDDWACFLQVILDLILLLFNSECGPFSDLLGICSLDD